MTWFSFLHQSKPEDCTRLAEKGDTLTVHYTVSLVHLWVLVYTLEFTFTRTMNNTPSMICITTAGCTTRWSGLWQLSQRREGAILNKTRSWAGHSRFACCSRHYCLTDDVASVHVVLHLYRMGSGACGDVCWVRVYYCSSFLLWLWFTFCPVFAGRWGSLSFPHTWDMEIKACLASFQVCVCVPWPDQRTVIPIK